MIPLEKVKAVVVKHDDLEKELLPITCNNFWREPPGFSNVKPHKYIFLNPKFNIVAMAKIPVDKPWL